MKKIEDVEIEQIDYEYQLVLDCQDEEEVVLCCTDEIDALLTQRLMGGEIQRRNIFVGVWNAFSPEGSLPATGQ